ncbi:hypothetical protein LTR08_008780 [Meristemomyces frigidus]|nr:hypothetical protein LTR08_008780 [Meristemomyces frigidus]
MILGEAHSAWTWHEPTQEYFLTLFTPEQPDLNWRNPAVRRAVHDVLRFWLARGVGGFRMDVINLISKVARMHDEVLAEFDTITVGEMPFVHDADGILKVVGAGRQELNMIFIFDLVDVDNTPGSFRLTLHPWTGPRPAQNHRDGWNSVFVENHDNPRSISRYADDSDASRHRSAKLLCLMQTTLAADPVHPTKARKLGMRNLPPAVPPEAYNGHREHQLPEQDARAPTRITRRSSRKARDVLAAQTARPCAHARAMVRSGFCAAGVRPWMIVNADYETVNAEAQRAFASEAELSVLQFWTRGLARRKARRRCLCLWGL